MVDPLVVEPEPVQHLARLALERVAPQVCVLLLHLAEARQDGVQITGPDRVGHRLLERLQFVMQLADPAAAGDGLVQHRPSRHLLHFLAEVADGESLWNRHLAVVRRLLAHDHPEEGGLAGAVRADEPDLLAGVELEGRLDEEDLPPILLADVGERDHDRGAILSAAGADVNLPGSRRRVSTTGHGGRATIGRRSSGKRTARKGKPDED